jgi:hypothetical protein
MGSVKQYRLIVSDINYRINQIKKKLAILRRCRPGFRGSGEEEELMRERWELRRELSLVKET